MEYTKDQPVQREKASRYGENRRDKGGMEDSQNLHLRVATPFVALPVWQRRSGEGTRHRQPPTAAAAPYRRIGEQLRLATGRRSHSFGSLVPWYELIRRRHGGQLKGGGGVGGSFAQPHSLSRLPACQTSNRERLREAETAGDQ